MMRIATEPDVAARIFDVNAYIDVSDIVSQVRAPTLILHARKDGVVPFDEGRRLAAAIPNARLVELDTPNHVVVHNEPAMPRMIDEIERFLLEHPGA
jgi:pimeloyl-ACP methyl ester carboxylesterase